MKGAPNLSPKSKHPPVFVAIVGGSGAGKTWLARQLQRRLGKRAVRISLDDFYRDRSHIPISRRAVVNFDDPRAIDWITAEKVILRLRANRIAELPRYSFRTHSRLDGSKPLQPKPIVLIDGLWLLRRPSLRRWFNLRIFIECPRQTRLRRRLARDVVSRGRTRTSVQKQFRETVDPMHVRFVQPQKRWADVVLPHNFGGREVQLVLERLETMGG